MKPEWSRRGFLTAAGLLAGARGGAQDVTDRLEAPAERRMLQTKFPQDTVSASLLRGWRRYPDWHDRKSWDALAPAASRRMLVDVGAGELGREWASLPATLFLEFRRNGNRSRYEAVRKARRDRLRRLVLAECFEGQGRFADEIANGLWLTCEETYWGLPAHVGVQKAGSGLPDVEEPTVDLFAADTGSLVAWTDQLLAPVLDKVSPLLRRRLRFEVHRRILTPCRDRNDFWWMGIDPALKRAMNNWNPWINSNWLTCALLMEDDAHRAATVFKVIRSVDRFLDSYHPDGGCDEGPGYWGHAGGSLFECLDLLDSASGGKLNAFDIPLVGEIGKYIYRAHISGDWYVNFADASARIGVNGPLIYRFGQRIGDLRMAAHGAWARGLDRTEGKATTETVARTLDAMRVEAEMAGGAGAKPPLVGDVFLRDSHFFAARRAEGSDSGFFVAAQGGHNNESHNHNDVGNFVVFLDGRPVLIDVGVETYTAKTFSSKRYEIWTMQSAWHNCPTINGAMQAAGRRFEASEVSSRSDGTSAEFALKLERAYPPEAGVERWRRTIRLDRAKNRVEVRDEWRLSKTDSLEWSFITVRKAAPAAGGVSLEGVTLAIPASCGAQVEERKTDDARLLPVWGDTIRRVLVNWKDGKPPREGSATFVIG